MGSRNRRMSAALYVSKAGEETAGIERSFLGDVSRCGRLWRFAVCETKVRSELPFCL
jgi:hypothetical protein